MMLRFLAFFTMLLLLTNISFAQTVRTEKEPNNLSDQANFIQLGEIIQGVINEPTDSDIFKIHLPKAGKIKARIWGIPSFPSDCSMDLSLMGRGSLLGRVQAWQLGKIMGGPLELVYDAQSYDKELSIIVGLSYFHIRTCDGENFCVMRCSPDGPWYLTFEKGQPKNVPDMYQNRFVKTPITYYLVVTYADQAPPTYEPPRHEPAKPLQPQKTEFIKNGNFSGSANWTIHDWYNPSQGKGEVFFEPDGVKFLSRSGNNRVGIMQRLSADVKHCKSLVLSATVKVDAQTLTGTGHNGREAPVAVFMNYTDEKGNVHKYLWENPYDTSQKMFWHGFYFLDPTPPSTSVHGTRVQKGAWFNYSYDLMQLTPKPVYVEFVGAEGAGWAVREGKIGRLSLICN